MRRNDVRTPPVGPHTYLENNWNRKKMNKTPTGMIESSATDNIAIL